MLFFVDDEIANGGLYQVYWNLPGAFVNEAVHDAEQIGAKQWARLVGLAGEILFPGGIPNDLYAQRRAIGCPDYCDKGFVERLNGRWHDGELRPALLHYVEGHAAEFYETAA